MNFLKNSLKKTMALLPVMLMLLTGTAAQAAFEPIELEATAGRAPLEEKYLPDMAGYEDESITVHIENMREHETNILVARVKIDDPSQIRTAMAARYGSTGTVLPDRFAKRVNAVLAVNGDFFSFNSTGYLVHRASAIETRRIRPAIS